MSLEKERGGVKHGIAAMLKRGCSFDEIDAARAEIEHEDRERQRAKWRTDVATKPR